jgi:hypothetical protein
MQDAGLMAAEPTTSAHAYDDEVFAAEGEPRPITGVYRGTGSSGLDVTVKLQRAG